MNAEQAILSRRSCRKFQTKDVPKELIDKLVLAGRSAPTGLDRQKLKFYIILNDIKRIHSIAEKVYKNLTKDGKKRDWIDDFRKRYEIDEIIFYDAPCIIAVVINKEETERERILRNMEGGCAVENILIMATSLGLGTVPIGVANLENQGFVLDELGADKDKETLLLTVAVGYPVEGYYEKYPPEKKLTSFVKYC